MEKVSELDPRFRELLDQQHFLLLVPAPELDGEHGLVQLVDLVLAVDTVRVVGFARARQAVEDEDLDLAVGRLRGVVGSELAKAGVELEEHGCVFILDDRHVTLAVLEVGDGRDDVAALALVRHFAKLEPVTCSRKEVAYR